MEEVASSSGTGEEEESGSGDSEEEETGSESTSYEESEEEEEEEEEPVLKYKRFAKDVVSSISEGPDGERNIMRCIAVHPKASR